MPITGHKQSHSWIAVSFAALQGMLVIATICLALSGKFAPPAPITASGEAIDRQYDLTLAVIGVVFVAAQVALGLAALWYRDRGQLVSFSRGNNALELSWTCITAVFFVSLSLLGSKAWANGRLFPAKQDNVIQIEVTENQFVFNFRYPGPDKRFGRLDPKQVDASIGNPLGLDSSDAASADDIVVPTLTVPVNREVELLIRAQDVIHSFFVRELRLQQDAVPGLIVPVRFKAEKIGRYEIVCTQLCGLGHANMHSYLDVVSAENYEAFLVNGGQ